MDQLVIGYWFISPSIVTPKKDCNMLNSPKSFVTHRVATIAVIKRVIRSLERDFNQDQWHMLSQKKHVEYSSSHQKEIFQNIDFVRGIYVINPLTLYFHRLIVGFYRLHQDSTYKTAPDSPWSRSRSVRSKDIMSFTNDHSLP
jgi:hypothetical protein